jgi:hypothetical protein
MVAMKTKKKPSIYSLQKITNAVVKWTGIMTSLCLDKAR